jgi:hypothetical protein
MWWLHGIQIIPPDHALVPPTLLFFSKIATEAPSDWAVIAAVSAAAPLPSTTTS